MSKSEQQSDLKVRGRLIAALTAAGAAGLTRDQIYADVFKYGTLKRQIDRVIEGLKAEGLVEVISSTRPVVIHRPFSVVRLVDPGQPAA